MKGTIHPITQIYRVAVATLGDMGFDIISAPEVDTPWHNFDGLRLNPDHPARLGHKEFSLTNGKMLRTHVSNTQLYALEHKQPPLRVMYMGKSYRDDASDASHEIVFNQLECLAIEEDLSVANLLSVLDTFVRRLFGPDVIYRFRPHLFPFTEPSIEVDIWHHNKWTEILGSGMVHPEVLTNIGVDPTRYKGFAFAMGIERLAYIKWGTDIRDFHANKLAFLTQFKETA
jgi:phenylalanyl-tRNA synthetase alpha chain